MSLSGRTHDSLRAAQGQGDFRDQLRGLPRRRREGQSGAGCAESDRRHLAVWRRPVAIIETISKGRNGVMPAWGDFLGPSKVHLLAAYVYGLSHPVTSST